MKPNSQAINKLFQNLEKSTQAAEAKQILDKFLKTYHGIEIHQIKDKDQYNLLNHFCLRGNLMMVEILLEMPNVLMMCSDEIIQADAQLLMTNPLCATVSHSSDNHRKISKALVKKGVPLSKIDTMHDTILQLACNNGHEEAVKFCIDKGLNVNETKPTGLSPLYTAAENGYKNIVELLLDAGANIECRSEKNLTPLCIAVQNNQVEVVKLLIERNANVMVTCNGFIPLYTACELGYEEIVELLIAANADVNYRVQHEDVSVKDATPLFIAAQQGYLNIVASLLKHGANPNFTSGIGTTPLIIAAENGHLEIVQLLLDNNALINAVTNDNSTALELACYSGHHQVVQYLMQHKNFTANYSERRTPLSIAVYNGHLKVVETILSLDKSLIDVATDDCTPLYIAARNGYLDIVKLLLKEGANYNALSQSGFSALYVACEKKHIEIVKLLLQQDHIRINQMTKKNPINISAYFGYLDILKLLIKKIKTTNEPLFIAEHALIGACMGGQLEVAKYLVSEGYPINHVDLKGTTPLSHAVYENRKDCVIWLLENGADVNHAENDGITSFFYACARGCLDIAKILLNYGADCEKPNNNGVTPFHAACIKGQLEVVEWLLSTNKIDIHSLSKIDTTPLISAYVNSQEATCKLLLKNKVDVNQQTKPSSISILHIACLKGDLTFVKKLMEEHHANINLANDDGETPLYIACERAILAYKTALPFGEEVKNRVFIKSLLKLGANPYSQNSQGKTVLELALENEYKELIQLLLENNQQQTLQNACFHGKLAIVKLCIDQNISIQIKNAAGLTPLDIAVQQGQEAVVQLLIEHNDIKRDMRREDALRLIYLACCHGHSELMKILINKYRIRANELDKPIEDKTLLYIACQKGFVNVVDYLLSQEVDIDKSNTKQKMTPLHIASLMGKPEIVTLLLKADARTDKTNADGCMPLHLAYEHSQYGIVKQLLSVTKKHQALLIACSLGQKYLVQQLLKIANKNIINKADLKNDGKTPLHYVCESGDVAIAQLLIDAGAKVTKKTEGGMTPLYLACKAGHVVLVEYLLTNTKVDINETMDNGETAMTLAIKQKHEEMIRLLVKYGADTTSLKTQETYMSDGKCVPTYALLFSNKPERNRQKPLKKSAEQTEELDRLASITCEEQNSVSLPTLFHKQNDCTFANGALSPAHDDLVKEIHHNGHRVPNVYFYMKKSVLDEVKASALPHMFDALLNAPQMNVFNGLKRLKNIHPDLWEIKQQHSPARIYCFRFKSDSQEPGKQGSIIVAIKFSEKGAHTQGEIKAIIQALKTNPEFKMFYADGRSLVTNSHFN